MHMCVTISVKKARSRAAIPLHSQRHTLHCVHGHAAKHLCIVFTRWSRRALAHAPTHTRTWPPEQLSRKYKRRELYGKSEINAVCYRVAVAASPCILIPCALNKK